MNNMLMDKAKTADSYIKSLEEELFSMRDRIKDEQNEDYIDVHVDRGIYISFPTVSFTFYKMVIWITMRLTGIMQNKGIYTLI